MVKKKKVEESKDTILKEIKAGINRIDEVCWDKGCKLAMESEVARVKKSDKKDTKTDT